eukprot:9499269-Pyramimonas_sp.AAC.1
MPNSLHSTTRRSRAATNKRITTIRRVVKRRVQFERAADTRREVALDKRMSKRQKFDEEGYQRREHRDLQRVEGHCEEHAPAFVEVRQSVRAAAEEARGRK